MEIKSIQKLVDDSIALKTSEPRESSGKFNPSYLGQCHRKHFWKRKGEKGSPIDSRTFRVFECGHLFEYFVAQLIPKSQKQICIKTENFLGFADIVTDIEVMDIKSINSKSFWYMKKDGYDITKEKRHNILQVMFYAKELNKKKGRLVFISKDDLCIEEYGFYMKNWGDDLQKEIDILLDYWAKNELPEAKPQMKWECKYCQFKDKCKQTKKEMKK